MDEEGDVCGARVGRSKGGDGVLLADQARDMQCTVELELQLLADGALRDIGTPPRRSPGSGRRDIVGRDASRAAVSWTL